MDRVLGIIDLRTPDAPASVRKHLALIAPYCRWTAGVWEDLGWRWNDVENLPRHLQELSSYLIRVYLRARAESR